MKLYLFLLILGLLSACSRLPYQIHERADWLQHQQSVQSIPSWLLLGRVILDLPQKSLHTRLYWKQNHHHYQIRLTTSFGQNIYVLEGESDKPHISDSLNDIPDGLNPYFLAYWIRGIPHPDVKYRPVALDADGRLIKFKQVGMVVDYQSYDNFSGYVLPRTMRLKNRYFEARIMIQDWLF